MYIYTHVYIGHSDQCGSRQTLFHTPSYNNVIHSEKNHIRNITLHHSSIKAKKITVLDTPEPHGK